MSDVNWKDMFYWGMLALFLFAVLAIIVPPASAYPYVYQGENVTQGSVYDISGVAGFGEHYGEFAYWKDWWQEGGASTPTIINRIERRYLFSVCMDEKRWVVGNWYKYNGEENYMNENNFAFSVKRDNTSGNSSISCKGASADPTPVPTAIIYDITGVPTSIPTEVTTTVPEYIAMVTPERTPNETITLKTTPTIVIRKVVTGATPTFPPPKGLPLSPIVIVIAVMGAIIIAGRR
jgi:hypothetical protein